MKYTLAVFLVIVSFTSFAKEKARKVSNSSYYECFLERMGDDDRNFRKQYLFPYPTETGETYELKGSLRWNSFKAVFSHDGSVVIEISEKVNGKSVSSEKSHKLGKEPQFNSMKVQIDVKGEGKVIRYHLSCSPE